MTTNHIQCSCWLHYVSLANVTQHFVDSWHRVCVSDRTWVQVTTITGNANTTVLPSNTHDRTRHQSVQRSHRPRHRALVWRTAGSHLSSHEPVGGLNGMHHRVAPSGSAVELFRELVEQLASLLSWFGLKLGH